MGHNFIEKIKKHKSEIAVNIVTTSLIIPVTIALGYLSFQWANKLYTHPRFLGASTYRGSSFVTFNDNFAPGMKAFVKYIDTEKWILSRDKESNLQFSPNSNFNKDKERRMPLIYKAIKSCSFSIPEEALKKREFTVYSIDRDRNKSKPKKLYVIEDLVVESLP